MKILSIILIGLLSFSCSNYLSYHAVDLKMYLHTNACVATYDVDAAKELKDIGYLTKNVSFTDGSNGVLICNKNQDLDKQEKVNIF